MKKLLAYFLVLTLFSCSNDKDKQVSKLLPKDFNITQSQQNQYGIPSKVEIYTFDNHILNYNQIKDFPIELKEDGWSFKKWHLVKNEKEKHYLFGMLDLAQYPITINDKTNHVTDILTSIKKSIKDKNGYVSYYYRKPKEYDFYKNGYIEFYCLQPNKQRIIYISFGDI